MNDVQSCILNIYKEVKAICDKHEIHYFGTDGTCLGAIRHQGFIPWDDDMDIVIPVEEYDRFLKYAKKELPSYLEVHSPFEKPHFAHLMFKIVDKRTTFIEKALLPYEDSWSGVWLDIIILCGAPKNIFHRNLFYAYLWKQMYCDLYIREDYLGSHMVPIQKKLKKFILTHRDTNYYMKKQKNYIRRYPVRESKYVLEAGFFHFKRWTSKTSFFRKRKEVVFEDTKIFIPADYDKYLKNMYGDYLKIPPKSEQKGHIGYVDLNRSYKYYVNNPEKVQKYFKNKEQ